MSFYLKTRQKSSKFINKFFIFVENFKILENHEEKYIDRVIFNNNVYI
jgi:hypothetical protein